MARNPKHSEGICTERNEGEDVHGRKEAAIQKIISQLLGYLARHAPLPVSVLEGNSSSCVEGKTRTLCLSQGDNPEATSAQDL